MRHILQRQLENGSWPTVGMNDQIPMSGSYWAAVRHAEDWAHHSKRAVRVCSWHEHNYYRNETPDRVQLVRP